jgi:RNA polymerase sigma-70 factor (ECF subfamily)
VDERTLIGRVLAGDAAAERALYDAHVDRVYRLCWRLAGGDRDLAQDFAQETFVRAFDRLSAFRGDAALSTWLHAIAVSVSLNGLRRHRRRQQCETSLNGNTAAAAVTAPDATAPELRARLREAIAALPDRYRTVFVLYDVEGYTHEEIGRVLDMPTGTSKARLSRARARLRQALAAYAGDRAP